ncbi:unnamed protein product, partial [Sphacelaria rigidula]
SRVSFSRATTGFCHGPLPAHPTWGQHPRTDSSNASVLKVLTVWQPARCYSSVLLAISTSSALGQSLHVNIMAIAPLALRPYVMDLFHTLDNGHNNSSLLQQ